MAQVKDRFQTWLGIEVWKLPEWYSRKQISTFLGCAKSPQLILLLKDAVIDGTLEVQWFQVEGVLRSTLKYRITQAYRDVVMGEVTHGTT